MKNKKIVIPLISLILFGSFVIWKFVIDAPSANNPKSFETNYVEDENQPLADEGDIQESVVDDNKAILPAPTQQPPTIEQPNLTRAEVSGDFIRVSAIFSQPSNGECELNIKRDGYSTFIEKAAIIVGPNYYTCNGFRVAKSQFAQGQWEATITHKWNDSISTSEMRPINVQ